MRTEASPALKLLRCSTWPDAFESLRLDLEQVFGMR